jgi:GAF domain-containing protein
MSHVVAGDGASGIEHVLEVGELVSDPTMDLDTKLERLFEIETEAFDLPYGFLTRIDPSAGEQAIEIAHGSHEHLQDGKRVSLSKSYCRKTIREPDGVFHVDDARKEGWTDDPAHQYFQLDTYIGATIGSKQNVHGTLCFASTDPRERRITATERRFLKLLATWVQGAIELQFECECGQRLFPVSSRESDGEVANRISCEGCGNKYAVTITKINDARS